MTIHKLQENTGVVVTSEANFSMKSKDSLSILKRVPLRVMQDQAGEFQITSCPFGWPEFYLEVLVTPGDRSCLFHRLLFKLGHSTLSHDAEGS